MDLDQLFGVVGAPQVADDNVGSKVCAEVFGSDETGYQACVKAVNLAIDMHKMCTPMSTDEYQAKVNELQSQGLSLQESDHQAILGQNTQATWW